MPALATILSRVLCKGPNLPARRVRALLHTAPGRLLRAEGQGRGVEHIHVHHGYFASWIAMVAARLLGIRLQLDAAWLRSSSARRLPGYQAEALSFCVTVSEFNRRFVLEHYPAVEPAKSWCGAWVWTCRHSSAAPARPDPELPRLTMLAVGRLHPVKDHAFLFSACHELKSYGTDFLCLIAGEGPERPWLEHLIRNLGLEAQVKLLGHLSRQQLDACYGLCDLVVLTSRSEGIPLVLMEAMAHGKTVLAPAITGIPELVKDGETGFLYRAGSLEDFVSQNRIDS